MGAGRGGSAQGLNREDQENSGPLGALCWRRPLPPRRPLSWLLLRTRLCPGPVSDTELRCSLGLLAAAPSLPGQAPALSSLAAVHLQGVHPADSKKDQDGDSCRCPSPISHSPFTPFLACCPQCRGLATPEMKAESRGKGRWPFSGQTEAYLSLDPICSHSLPLLWGGEAAL